MSVFAWIAALCILSLVVAIVVGAIRDANYSSHPELVEELMKLLESSEWSVMASGYTLGSNAPNSNVWLVISSNLSPDYKSKVTVIAGLHNQVTTHVTSAKLYYAVKERLDKDKRDKETEKKTRDDALTLERVKKVNAANNDRILSLLKKEQT